MDALFLGLFHDVGTTDVNLYGPVRMAIPPTAVGATRLRIVRGEDRTYAGVVYDGLGQLLDLTGHAITTKLRKKHFGEPTEGDVVLTKTWVILSPPQGGAVQLTFTSAETLALPDAEYMFDVWDLDAVGNETQVLPPSTLSLTDGISFP